MSNAQQELRSYFLRFRKQVCPDVVQQKSAWIVSRFLTQMALSPLFFQMKNVRWDLMKVGLYSAFSGEVDLRCLAEVFKKLGVRLYYPKIIDSKKKIMHFVSEGDTFGDEVSLDWIFIPGVVFGYNGERIGMGQGYYDRWLVRSTGGLRIALVFDFQVLPSLEQKETDQCMDWVISEKRTFQTSRFVEWCRQKRCQRLIKEEGFSE